MFGIIFLAISSYVFWQLFVKGLFWQIIVGFFAWVGMYGALATTFPSSVKPAIMLAGLTFSWAGVIPTIIVWLAFSYAQE